MNNTFSKNFILLLIIILNLFGCLSAGKANNPEKDFCHKLLIFLKVPEIQKSLKEDEIGIVSTLAKKDPGLVYKFFGSKPFPRVAKEEIIPAPWVMNFMKETNRLNQPFLDSMLSQQEILSIGYKTVGFRGLDSDDVGESMSSFVGLIKVFVFQYRDVLKEEYVAPSRYSLKH